MVKLIKVVLLIVILLGVIVIGAGFLSKDDISIPEGAPGQYLNISGINIRFHQIGEGQDVLFIHGVPGCLEDWDPVISRLPKGFRATVYDRPNQGYSAPAGMTYPLDFNARIAFDLIETLQLKDVIVVGHSYGGRIIMAMAVKQPEHVKAFIPVAGASYPVERIDPRMYILNIPYLGRGIAAITIPMIGPGMIEKGVTDAFYPNLEAMPKDFMEHRSKIWTQPKVVVGVAREHVHTNSDINRVLPDYSRISNKFIIIHGTEDRLVPVRDSIQLNKTVKDSQVVLLEKTGHQVQFVNPDAIWKAIEEAAGKQAL
jgi:pimeloyl-ACP methyl ester carboxylesterase